MVRYGKIMDIHSLQTLLLLSYDHLFILMFSQPFSVSISLSELLLFSSFHLLFVLGGLVEVQSIVRRGIRQSASKSFLYPALRRSNLHVMSDAIVTKVRSRT